MPRSPPASGTSFRSRSRPHGTGRAPRADPGTPARPPGLRPGPIAGRWRQIPWSYESRPALPREDSPGLARLEGLIGYTLRRAQVAVSRSFVELFADLDVRQSQLGVLTVIEGSPGLRPSQVGAAIGIKRANIGPLLDELEARSLVRREPDPTDRRSQSLFLTPTARP